MAHSGVQQDHHCKDCGLYFDSIKSLDVHLHYHKENLLIKWATQPDETNNNNASSNKQRSGVTTAPADSSDGMMKTEPGRPSGSSSPQPNSFNHPPTPSSYSSAPSPFQDSSAQRFSPMASTGYTLSDRTPPQQQNGALHPFHQQYSNFLPPNSEGSGYFMDGSGNSGYILGSGTDFPASSNVDNLRSSPNSVSSPSPSSIGHVVTSTGIFRYHPYHQPQSSGSQLYVPDRNNGVTSSGPSPSSYQPPPTPHQCDKCGFVCNSSSALLDHLNTAHPPAAPPSFMNNQMRFQQEAMFRNYHGNNEGPDTAVGGQQAAAAKSKDEPAAEILDLDSHKVHQVYQPEEATTLRAAAGSEGSNRGGNPHSVSAMLWGSAPQNSANPHATSSTTPPEFHGVTSPEGMTVPQQQPMTYQKTGPYPQHLAPTSGQVMHPHLHHITSVPNNISSSSLPPPGPIPSTSPHQHKNGPLMQQASQQPGNQTWKSNEARRPKTYNCSACNKWFTSSGHLKRHYNTTLHKNAVKQSGAPDPATQPISNHHHPGRAATDVATSARGVPSGESHVAQQSPVPAGLGPQLVAMVEDSSRSEDASSNGNFGRITPSVQHSNLLPAGNQQQATSPPNLMAGPSITLEAQTGGLQYLTSSYSSENNLLHNPSDSVRTSPVPAPQIPPEALLHQLGAPQALSSQHPYMLGQVVSPPCPQPPPSLPLTHHLIHHSIPQHQPLHPSQHPTPPPTLQMTNLTEMYSPNGQPPHISILQEHQPMLPTSINNHLITITGNCGSSGGTVSPLNLQDDQQFLFPITSSPQQDNQPLPSFAQIGHHPFGANSLTGFSGLTAPTSSPSYSMVSTGPTTTMIDNVGGLLNSDHQHLLATMKHSDAYNNNNNSYWVNNFEAQNSLLDDTSSNALQVDSNGSGGDENASSNLSPARTPDCQTSSVNFDKSLQLVTGTTDTKREDDITSTGTEEVTAVVANNNNINTTTNNNKISNAKNSIFKSMSISSGDLHKCLDCDKVFNKACYLTQHNKSFHSGHKPFKCDRCGKRFTAEFMYQQHKGKHAGDKPYKCEMCPKQFNHKTDLRRHMCLHTGEKPYECHVCRKGFIRKDHMLKHCETHRRKTAHLQHNSIQVVSAQ